MESLIEVECDMENALKGESLNNLDSKNLSDNYFEILTIIHHDSEETRSVHGYESPGSYVRYIHYNGNSLKQIEKVIDSSFTCQQYIRWECRGSTFSFWYPKNYHSWWVDRNGNVQNYWGNAETDSGTCGCFPYCHTTVKNSTCNCDANLKSEWLEDSGLLLAADRLPVTQLCFGDTSESYEAGKHTLGPLICRAGGHRKFFMGNSLAPIIIYSPGYPNHYPSAFRHYEWKVLARENELIELVFPDYDILHYGAYNSVPGCRFVLQVDVYQQNKSSLDSNNEDDYNLESNWVLVKSIKRENSAPPYYVTDGKKTLFVMKFVTCNQVRGTKVTNKGLYTCVSFPF